MILHTGADAAAAARCELPAAFGIAAEDRGSIATGGGAVIVIAHPVDAAETHDEQAAPALRAGDVIRQANGSRVDRCADLEHAAAEAFAKGLRLLVLVERQQGTFAFAAGGPAATSVARVANSAGTPAAEARSGAARTAVEGASSTGATAPDAYASGHEAGAARADVGPETRPGKPARAVRAAAILPPRHEVGAETIEAVAAALRALQPLNDAAVLTMPVTVYERRLGDAETTITALTFGPTEAALTVQATVEEVLAFHRTARDIWQARLAYLRSRGIDRRGVSGQPLPYFSDSQVPEWVGEYPFLQTTVLSVPRETRVLQAAGSWDAERAIELLWTRAQESTERLAAWLRG